MSDIEARLNYIEDRLALQDLILKYCNGIDEIKDVDSVVDCFVDDGVLDLTGLGLGSYTGKKSIHEFFSNVFESMKYEAHYSTNFTLHELSGNYAKCHAYVIGMGVSHAGVKALVHARHVFECEKTQAGWKIARFEEPLLLPLPDKLDSLYE